MPKINVITRSQTLKFFTFSLLWSDDAAELERSVVFGFNSNSHVSPPPAKAIFTSLWSSFELMLHHLELFSVERTLVYKIKWKTSRLEATLLSTFGDCYIDGDSRSFHASGILKAHFYCKSIHAEGIAQA